MEYQALGQSGLKVSPLCLGTMLFGRETNETDSQRIISSGRAAGINFIDTADTYVDGASEEIVGRCVRSNRNDWILATKLANKMGGNPNHGGLSRQWVFQACDHSLQRLGTDHIDLYYFHKEDHLTPLEESVRAIGDLIRWGKVRYFGLSNYRSWRVAEICNICDRMGLDRPIASQPYYNAMNRMPELEHLPACRHYGLGVVPYSPLARGILTGKYSLNKKPEDGSRVARNDRRMMQTEWRAESIEIAQKINLYAQKKGATSVDIAVAWLLNNKVVNSIIAGPRTLAQWDSYLNTLNYTFTDEDEDLINSFVVSGHSSTPGYNDPSYPIEGRYRGV